MRHLFSIALLACSLVATSTPVLADMFAPSSNCRKPIKPYRFTSEWEVSNFRDEVDRYKRCIADFVQEQKDASAKHMEAANDAIEEWNAFVRYELQ